MTPVRIGIAGMGAAGLAFVPAIRKHPEFEWVAFAEPVETVRQRSQQEYWVIAYASLSEMLTHSGLDAVYIATPTELHAQQVLQVAAAGKHILLEKPMAVSLDEGRTMIEATERAGVVLVIGHSHSHDLPIKCMQELISSGELGGVRMVHTWCYTDWMHRPRRPEELDVGLGGGVTFRQGSHQFDILRLLCGGQARSVRARTFDWHPRRRSIGAHTVFIDFDNGAVATAVYNGYGGFSSMDLCNDISEWGFHQPPAMRQVYRDQTQEVAIEDELRLKQERARSAIPAQAPHQPFFGLTLVSCERGDIRQSAQGLYIYDQQGVREMLLPTDQTPRDLVLNEFHEAIAGESPALHDGRWGLANLEICIAAMTSSSSGSDVRLHEQVGLPARTPGGSIELQHP